MNHISVFASGILAIYLLRDIYERYVKWLGGNDAQQLPIQ